MKTVLIIVAVVLGLALVTCVGGGIFIAGKLGDVAADFEAAQADMSIVVDAPPEVQMGQPFQIRVRATNNGEVAHEVKDLDVWYDLATAFDVTGVEPSVARTHENTEQITYSFNQELQPGETAEFVVNMVGNAAGEFSGTIDLSIDNIFNIIETSVTLTVSDAG